MTCKETENLIRKVIGYTLLGVSYLWGFASLVYVISSWLFRGDAYYGLKSGVAVLELLNGTGLLIAFTAFVVIMGMVIAWLAGGFSICEDE
jgi:hypothetical protein